MATTHTGLFRTAATLIMGAALATLAVGCDGAGETIGPRGGSLASDDGRFSLEIPAGALDSDVELSIEEVECELSTTIGSCYAVLPLGTTFLLPVEVAFEVADMNVTEDVGVVAQAADGWRVLADRDVDLDDAVVYGSAMYLSEYGLAEVE
ncbi:MAG: hypothetical protein ACRBN8_11530 [Nannocystales bacterium]